MSLPASSRPLGVLPGGGSEETEVGVGPGAAGAAGAEKRPRRKGRRGEMEGLGGSWEYKHPLEHTWTLWFIDNTLQRPWEECLMEVGSFSTIEDFWCLFNHIKPVSMVKLGCDYSLFKKGIRPMWEDKANKNGGRWVINIDKKVPQQKLDQYWMEISMCMIGECFYGYNEKICGATISIRGKMNRIGVWTADTDNSNGDIIHIGLKVKELLGFAPSQVITFQAHKDCQTKQGTAPKNTYYV